jgi:hypothetical protein
MKSNFIAIVIDNAPFEGAGADDNKPLLIPLRMVEEEGAKVMKSSLQLLMEQLAPVSIQTARSSENFMRRELDTAVDCQALR